MEAPERALSNADRRVLWAGMLVGPTVWITQLFALYALEDIISCTPGSTTPGLILGIGVPTIAASITAVAAALTALAGAGSLRRWRALRDGKDQPGYEWMALAGMITSALFLPVILIKLVPLAIIGTCVGGL